MDAALDSCLGAAYYLLCETDGRESLKVLQEMPQKYHSHPYWLLMAAEAYRRESCATVDTTNSKYDEALRRAKIGEAEMLKLVREVARQDSQDVIVLFNLAVFPLKIRSGVVGFSDYGIGLKYAHEAIERDPNRVELYFVVVNLILRMIDFFDGRSESNPEGLTLWQLYSDAERALSRAESLNADSLSLAKLRIGLLAMSGRRDEAKTRLEQARSEFPRDRDLKAIDKALAQYNRPPSSRDRMFNSFMKNALTQTVEKNATSAVANLGPEELAEYNAFMAAMNNPADAMGIRDAELGIHVIRAVEQGDPNFGELNDYGALSMLLSDDVKEDYKGCVLLRNSVLILMSISIAANLPIPAFSDMWRVYCGYGGALLMLTLVVGSNSYLWMRLGKTRYKGLLKAGTKLHMWLRISETLPILMFLPNVLSVYGEQAGSVYILSVFIAVVFCGAAASLHNASYEALMNMGKTHLNDPATL